MEIDKDDLDIEDNYSEDEIDQGIVLLPDPTPIDPRGFNQDNQIEQE